MMKKAISTFGGLLLSFNVLLAQTPAITYSSPQSFTQGTAISPVAPGNTGGAVSTPAYANEGTVSLAFNNPYGVAADASGNVYVADFGSGQVLRFTGGSGSPITIAAGFSSPKGLTIDRSGNLYVADAGHKAIKKIPAGGGTVVKVGPSFNSPVGLAVDAAGNLYVSDNSTNAVYKIPFGSGSAITLASGFGNPQGLAVDAAGNLFVCDVSGGVIKVPAGGRGNKIAYSSGLNEPVCVAIDGSGNLFVTDLSSLYKIAAGATSPSVIVNGLFNSAYGAAVDSSNKLYVTDNGNGLLAEITPKGGYYISPALPAGLRFSSSTGVISGTPVISNAATNYTVIAYNNAGSSQAIINISVTPSLPSVSYISPKTCYVDKAIAPLLPTVSNVATAAYGAPFFLGTGFLKPYGVAIDAAGNLYVADTYNSRVEKLPANGGAQETIGTGVSYPTSVAADAAGNVYITEQSGLFMIPSGGGSLVPVGSGFSNPTGVAIDKAGNIYVADYGNNAIKKIPSGGGVPIVVGFGFNNPSGVAVDAAGNLYVADSGNNAIKEIPAAGGAPVTLGSGFSGPVGVAVDGEGNVFVADGGNNAIKKIPAAGGAPVSLGSGFNAPNGVAVDASGKLFVADYGNNAVKLITPIGGYYIDTMLPSGLSISNATGAISGTPTFVSATTTYTISAYNINGFTQGKLKVRVLPSNNANLSSLKPSAGILSPAFTNATISYNLNVDNSVSSLKVTPTTAVAVSTVAINGNAVTSGTASGSIPLVVGLNTISIIVSAQDGVTTKTFTITVTRAPSAIATLSALVLSSGTLSPTFAAATTAYTGAVANPVTAITVTPTTTNTAATVTVNGMSVTSGTASGSIALNVGPNTVTTMVTAQDGVTTQTYTVTVTRAPSNNDNLSSIRLIPATTITLVAGPDYKDYTASVSNATASVQEVPTAAVTTSTITVNGVAVASGATSNAIPLNVGANTITTVVTAQDGVSTHTYVITITRAAGPIANPLNTSVSVSNPTDHPQMMGEEVNVHQGLSPNGDGINDFLLVDGITNYPDNKLTIMNRSGQLIFEAKGYDNSTNVFDGHSNTNGAMQLPGTYFFSLDYMVNGIAKHKIGYIILKY